MKITGVTKGTEKEASMIELASTPFPLEADYRKMLRRRVQNMSRKARSPRMS